MSIQVANNVVFDVVSGNNFVCKGVVELHVFGHEFANCQCRCTIGGHHCVGLWVGLGLAARNKGSCENKNEQ